MSNISYERSELSAERDEVLDDGQVLGHGAEGRRVCVRPVGEGSAAQVEPRAAGAEEGEVNGRDARSPSVRTMERKTK